MLEERLYENDENVAAIEKRSIISGLRRSKNLRETITPTNPRREARRFVHGGSFQCGAPRSCILALFKL